MSRGKSQDFPGGPVVKTLPVSAVGICLIPGQETKIPHAPGQLSRSCNRRICRKKLPASTKTPCSQINNFFKKRGKWWKEFCLGLKRNTASWLEWGCSLWLTWYSLGYAEEQQAEEENQLCIRTVWQAAELYFWCYISAFLYIGENAKWKTQFRNFYRYMCVSFSVMSDSVWLHGL